MNYQIVTQTPISRINDLPALARTPITSATGNTSQLLGNLATFRRDESPIIIDHYNIQPTFDIYADVDRRDLGGVSSDIHKIMDDETKRLPVGTTLALRGEVDTMQKSFTRLGIGIVFAIGLVYLLMAVNFQSWLDPVIILMALPLAFCGILWMLYLTQTTFSVPSLMGTIMTIGVATANSILMVVFANDEQVAGKDPYEAALNAGFTAFAASDYDGAGDDHRYAADGAGTGRRRRTECAAGTGGDRRTAAGDVWHAVYCAGDLLAAEEGRAGGLRQADRRGIWACDRSRQLAGQGTRTAARNAGAARLMAIDENEKRLSDGREHLGEEFADTSYGDDRKLGRAFDDPNSLDDAKLGHEFEKTNSSAKKHHRPVGEVVTEPFKKPKNKKILFWVIAAVVVLFLLILVLGWIPRHERKQETAERVKQQEESPTIEVMQVKRQRSTSGLVLPGTATPLTESSVYARANGYLKKRYVDIGDHVRKGQLLATIDAPDLDQQVDQARQQLSQAEAQEAQQETQLALTKVTVERYRVLAAKGVFSRQDADQREADFQAQVANVAAAQRNVEAFRANLRRNIALQSYEQIRAPFDGIVTQRNVENGDLISAQGSSGGSPPTMMGAGSSSSPGANGATNNYGSSGSGPNYATPSTGTGTQGGALFTIAQNNRLRILVSAPEGYAESIHIGQKAGLKFQEFPEQTFSGQVTRTAGAVDQNTRTMLAEIQVDNAGGHLLPGMYAVATFAGASGQGPLVISGDAVAVRKDTTTVAVVKDGVVHLVPVTLGRDFGPEIEVVAGLHEGDLVASTFTDEVKEDAKVKTKMSQQAQQQAQQPAPGSKPTPPGGSTQYGDPGIEDQGMQGQSAKPGQQKAQGASKSNGKQESKP